MRSAGPTRDAHPEGPLAGPSVAAIPATPGPGRRRLRRRRRRAGRRQHVPGERAAAEGVVRALPGGLPGAVLGERVRGAAADGDLPRAARPGDDPEPPDARAGRRGPRGRERDPDGGAGAGARHAAAALLIGAVQDAAARVDEHRAHAGDALGGHGGGRRAAALGRGAAGPAAGGQRGRGGGGDRDGEQSCGDRSHGCCLHPLRRRPGRIPSRLCRTRQVRPPAEGSGWGRRLEGAMDAVPAPRFLPPTTARTTAMRNHDQQTTVDPAGEAREVEHLWERVVGRRAFLRGASVAGVGAIPAVGALSGVSFADSARITKGDVAILRFLAAAELIESDLWQQYAELGGAGGGNAAYVAALENLDGDMPQYISDNTDDELSHAAFLNAYLASKGAEPVNLDRFRTLPSSRATGAKQIGRLTNLMSLDVDTSWYFRYRSTSNPDLGATFGQPLTIRNQPAIPVSDDDTPPNMDAPVPPANSRQRRMQAIAN